MDNPKTPPTLRELQTWMRWILTDPRGVADALSDPFPSDRRNKERYTSPAKIALPWIAKTPPIATTARLDIYAEAYFSRILDSMKSDFSITARLLGEVSFQKLLSDYLKEYPSQTPNIGEIGRNFSKFTSTYEDLKSVGFLKPLMEMEWLMIESFYAENTALLDISKLTSLSNDDWENVEFILSPSINLLCSQWPLDQLSQLNSRSDCVDPSNIEELEAPQEFLIFRENGLVAIKPISDHKSLLLRKLKEGQSLISALEQTQSIFPETNLESNIMDWFNEWVRLGIIYDLKIKRTTNEKSN